MSTTAAFDDLNGPEYPSDFEDGKPILVLGAGNFGTCLAAHLAGLNHPVTIWARDESVVESINNHHRNPKYLSTVTLPENLTSTSQLTASLIAASSVILLAIPTQHMRSQLESIKPHLHPYHLLIVLNKGIENPSLFLPHEIMADVLGPEIVDKAVFLSGPSFAIEVAKKQITCVSVASRSKKRALRTQMLFHAPYFRVYSTTDVVGVEIAGALKNVIAIASGACNGLGFEMNSRAALITRGLAEITRIGVALGANPLTFSGLSGVGDLFLTCTSEKSRNFSVGQRIAQGQTLDEVIRTLGSVAEGVETTRSAYHLCRKLGVDSPQIDAVYSVLFEGVDLMDALRGLIMRDPSEELRGIA
ncbi:6-phosphogluconate dehydrogenase [Cladochytrium replicatum]|nr:6-phosphogluconate dehydrogenase [Cladochytrium replicatum]